MPRDSRPLAEFSQGRHVQTHQGLNRIRAFRCMQHPVVLAPFPVLLAPFPVRLNSLYCCPPSLYCWPLPCTTGKTPCTAGTTPCVLAVHAPPYTPCAACDMLFGWAVFLVGQKASQNFMKWKHRDLGEIGLAVYNRKRRREDK